MADETWYSRYYKEKVEKQFSEREAKPKETPKEEKPKITSEFSRELRKTHPPTPSASRYLDYRKKEIEKQVKEGQYTEKPSSLSAQNIITPPKKPEFKPLYSKPYYPSYTKYPKIEAEEIESEKPKPDTNQVLIDVENKLMPENLNKTWIILGTLIIILIILGGIYFFTQQNTQTKFMPLDVVTHNASADSNILYNGKNLLLISSWETQIEYSNQTDRLFGSDQYKQVIFDDKGKAYTAITLDNQVRLEPLSTNPNQVTRIGWFTKSDNNIINEKKSFFDKQINIALSSDKDLIKNASFIYNLYKGKPYFKVQFSAETENNTNLGEFKYGLVLSGYDIYSQSGDTYINDNLITRLNKSVVLTLTQGKNITTNISQSLKNSVAESIDLSRQAVTRSGSSYEDNSDYQIFIDKNKTRAIVLYSPYILLFEDSFYWNVYWVDVLKLENGTYAPLYVIIIDNPKLTYNNETQDWLLDSKQYKGPIMSYINKVITNIGDETG